MQIEKHEFSGGMNGDDSVRLVPQNAMLNCMNASVSVSEYGRNQRLENRPGTVQIPNANLPAFGTHFCLGSVTDEARQRIIYFVFNTLGYSGIYAYDIALDTTYIVLFGSQVTGGLGFVKNYRVDRNARVIGDLLYWTDNNGEPHRINIEAGIKLNQPAYSTSVTPYTDPLSQSVINLIKRPFGLAITAAKTVDGGFAENFVLGFSGQAASRLVYRDGEYSVVSVPSAMLNYNLPTDTFNAIDFTFPLTETFDQDVQIVQLAVRYGNSPNYFIIRQWNKGVAADLAAINAHNAGSTALTFRYYNNAQGVPIGAADSIKPNDNIPLKAKTLEFSSNRLFLANYTKGYDTPINTSLAVSQVSGSGSVITSKVFKAFSQYQIAIQFRDNSKRKCFVVTKPALIASTPDRTYGFTSYITGLTWTLSNAAALTEIPDWAYYYDILITKNLRTRSFVSAKNLALQYVKKNPDGTFSYQQNYDGNVYGLSVSVYSLNAEGIGYLFDAESGDSLRLYLAPPASSTVYDLPVLAQDAINIIVQPKDLGNLVGVGATYEIYTPYKTSENEDFYTTGQTFLVTNPTNPTTRAYSTLTGTISGDVYRVYDWGVEAMSPNNTVQWNSWTDIYGERNFSSLLGQVSKTNFISWSNVKIIGAQTNGLSTFDALDEKSIPQECGQINKLQLTNKISDLGQGNIMLAICPTETASLYLGERQLMDASAQGNVSVSTEVIGTVNVLNGSRGTTNPETVISIWGLVFWYDLLNGAFVQYSTNGVEDVSRYKTSRFFKNYAKAYLAASTNNLDNINGFHHIPTCVDPFYKEIICSLPALIYENYATNLPSYSSVPSYATSIINRFDIYDQLSKAMAFKFEYNVWGSNYNYTGAEWFEYVGNQMYGFKAGLMYKHNSDTTNWNRFYGTSYPMRVCFTGNVSPSLLKVLNNIAIEGNTIPNFTVAYADYPNIQITDIADTDTDIDGNLVWDNQEGNLYATFFKDRLSPNSSGTADQKLFTGDDITDIAIKVMIEIQAYESLVYINFVDIGWDAAKGQKQIANPINT